ncbi:MULTISPECIES: CehA/McbA family metallohydrolase [unclassified Paenibacillus]|uniref:CehA/McbA family metallohydrolase n=1 Tax=unclassified Paenibacillus TaxID=185978 RepID=UPI0017885CDF|nr:MULTISPECIES: CehA/McbA family metallohydrolase [unclassified Paenibacillus]MBE0335144.1 PHP domain-containing protein [Paenibacillus sp. 23TSA30-6]
MKDAVYLDKSKRKYKGNLHLHTTWSDGSQEALDVVVAFKDKGYDFISITDHDVFVRTAEYDTDSFIVLPGMERGGLNHVPDKDSGYHFGVLGDPTIESEKEQFHHLQSFEIPIPWEGSQSPQKLIDEMKAHGNLVIFNHPEWHLTRFEDMVQYDGFFAIEIYNHATEWTPSSSYGAAYWDHALQNGKRVFGIAADDSHNHDPNSKIAEYGGGWVSVEAEELSQQGIIDALKKGQFYSSSGPEILDYRVEDGFVNVECSPCQYIMFKAFPQRGPFLVQYETGELMTSGSMMIQKDMQYIRVECVDEKGRVAWSNPIFVGDLAEEEQQ